MLKSANTYNKANDVVFDSQAGRRDGNDQRHQWHFVVEVISPHQTETHMTKIPSSKFSTTKKKIPSTKFPTAKRKLASGKLASQTAKIPSRKMAKKKVVTAPAPLGHPTDEQARQEAVEILKSRAEALKGGEKGRQDSP